MDSAFFALSLSLSLWVKDELRAGTGSSMGVGVVRQIYVAINNTLRT